MFKIGEFSRLARVTVDTLRHYDAINLLKPANVDPFTGYRYYSAKQLQPLSAIRTLKGLGFSLEEIAHILQGNLSEGQFQAMLQEQLATAQAIQAAAQTRVEQITAHLNSLNTENPMSTYPVSLKAAPSVTIATIREVVPTVAQVPERCGTMFNTIAEWLLAHKLPFTIPITIYHDESYSDQDIDTECAFILTENAVPATTPPIPITFRQLQDVAEVAFTIVTDDFLNKLGGLTPAYNAIAQWIETNGYIIIGPPRELFYGTPQQGDFTAEIQFPVTKA